MTDEQKQMFLHDILERVGMEGIGQVVLEQHNTFNIGERQRKKSAEAELNPVQQALMPIFMNNRTEMLAFYEAIDGASSTSITELVNRKVKEGIILRARCQNDLWSILHQYGLYKPSYSNWNSQVN